MGEPHQVSEAAKKAGQFLAAEEKLALEKIDRPLGLTDFRLKNNTASPVETVAVDGIITGFDMKFR